MSKPIDQNTPNVTVKITRNGPYIVEGAVPIREVSLMPNESNKVEAYQPQKTISDGEKPVRLCRCGQSRNKPFCDGQHIPSTFDGTCTAPHHRLMREFQVFEGPDYRLFDNPKYCAFARFCDAHGRLWNLLQFKTPYEKEMFLKEVRLCPTKRFIVQEKSSGKIITQAEEPVIQIIEDPALGVHGPIGVRGKITLLDEQNKAYEPCSRQALCRCGKSKNKPFCDGNHAANEPSSAEEKH